MTAGEETQVYNNFTVTELRRRISQFAPVTVSTDISNFTESETKVLGLLIAASKYLDPVFNRQSFRWYKETRKELVRQR